MFIQYNFTWSIILQNARKKTMHRIYQCFWQPENYSYSLAIFLLITPMRSVKNTQKLFLSTIFYYKLRTIIVLICIQKLFYKSTILYIHNLPYEKVGNNEPVCIANEVPFEISESWCLTRLINITSVFVICIIIILFSQQIRPYSY